jgi:multiple sugar transport system substrate-binding protein
MVRVLRYVGVATAALGVLAASACGSSASKSGGTAQAGTAAGGGDSNVTLKMWVMGDSSANATKLLADFTKSTGIKVTVQAIPWADVDTKLTTAVASGNGPDVTQVGLSQLPSFIAAGALQDISPQISKDPAYADANFPDGVASAKLNPAGKVYSVPWISDTRVLFYRTDLLSQAGISAPPATLTDLQADAVKLAARGSGKYGYYIPQWDAPLPIEFAWSMGGDVTGADGKVNFDTPEFRKAVDYYASFYKDKAVPTASDFDQAQGFISGSAPMLVSGPYLAQTLKTQAPELAGKWAVAPLPADSSSTALLAGSTVGVWKNSTHVDADMKLLDFLAQPATQLKWYALDGDLPMAKAALSDPSLTSDPNVQVYVKALQTAKLLPLVPAWDKISTKMLDAVNNIVLKGADPTSTLNQLNQDTAALQN